MRFQPGHTYFIGPLICALDEPSEVVETLIDGDGEVTVTGTDWYPDCWSWRTPNGLRGLVMAHGDDRGWVVVIDGGDRDFLPLIEEAGEFSRLIRDREEEG